MKKPLLHFVMQEDKKNYNIWNHSDEYIGTISYMRVGGFMHWCFCPDEDCFFTNGCLKEIVEFITKLYSEKKNV